MSTFADVVVERAGVAREVAERALERNPVAVRLLAALAIPSLHRAMVSVEAEVDLISPEDRAEALKVVVESLALAELVAAR